MLKNDFHLLQTPRENTEGSMTNFKRGENPQLDKDNFIGDSLEQEAILSDDDASTVEASMKRNNSEDEEESFHDSTGMVGPVHSHIEADNLTDEFLAGKVDLVQQMEKTVDAIQDAYEGELKDRQPKP